MLLHIQKYEKKVFLGLIYNTKSLNKIINSHELSKYLQDVNEETKAVTKASAMKGDKHQTRYSCIFCNSNHNILTKYKLGLLPDFKKRMDKNMDEVGIVARAIKMKLEEIDLDVSTVSDSLCFD